MKHLRLVFTETPLKLVVVNFVAAVEAAEHCAECRDGLERE